MDQPNCNSDKKEQCTIPSIDESVARLNGRLQNLLNNLRSATHGEQPVCAPDDEKRPISSASLESIDQRIDDAHNLVDTLETFMRRFHS